ncbi:hypothetical protein NDK50_07830 [Paraburkholderia bryophila]|uniref:hypothetical protein n=1 Tax=Paraburkholderia bryophila TaxID=420952 RepID=UPI0023490787|nr:hypothetical protein [Paraburkholderia bryophila]WCM21345.1 hypothetical protein NDK50_07830 [Paraburkholderia bryophila]
MKKSCSTCKLIKALSEFGKNSTKGDGLQSVCKACAALYRIANKEKLRAYSIAYNAENPEKRRTYNAKLNGRLREMRNASPQLKSQWNAYKRQSWAKNKESERARNARYVAKNYEKHLLRSRNWRLENPHKFRQYSADRRAAEARATPEWADKTVIREFYFAADFLGMVTGEWYHVDHIVPLKSKVVCGFHCETNLQVMLGIDNISKGNRHWPDMP